MNLKVNIATILAIFLLAPVLCGKEHQSFKNYWGTLLSELNFQEMCFIHANEDFKIAGMYFMAENASSAPLAVFIHGSDRSVRNNRWYLEMVKGLLDQGISVFLPDKRGSEKSRGNWRGIGIPQLSTEYITGTKLKLDHTFFMGRKIEAARWKKA